MDNQIIAKILASLGQRYQQQPEFIQAVKEVLESIGGFIEENPIYKEQGLLKQIVEPERIIIFRVPWYDDAGQVQVNRGYRVQFNSALGPYKGGLRFHPSVDLGVLKFLAFEQIFKNSLTGLPLGAGKGGSDFDPKGKSDTEVMRFCQRFMQELFRHVGPNTDIPAGDIGVGAREIGYLYGMYKKLANENTGVLTGKGVGWGGSYIRAEATGYGLIYFLLEILRTAGDKIEGKRILVSGAGNVAQYAAEKAISLGGKVITMSDSGGYIYVESGIDRELLAQIMDLKNVKRGRLSQLAESHDQVKYFPNKKPWGNGADIALPCATQNEIGLKDAKSLVASGVKYLAEGANMPTKPDAISFLQENNVLFAPGKAANAGGVAVSGLEMSQNAQHTSWERDIVDQKLREIMANIHKQIVTESPDNYLKGANIVGFKRVAQAMLQQGVV